MGRRRRAALHEADAVRAGDDVAERAAAVRGEAVVVDERPAEGAQRARGDVVRRHVERLAPGPRGGAARREAAAVAAPKIEQPNRRELPLLPAARVGDGRGDGFGLPRDGGVDLLDARAVLALRGRGTRVSSVVEPRLGFCQGAAVGRRPVGAGRGVACHSVALDERRVLGAVGAREGRRKSLERRHEVVGARARPERREPPLLRRRKVCAEPASVGGRDAGDDGAHPGVRRADRVGLRARSGRRRRRRRARRGRARRRHEGPRPRLRGDGRGRADARALDDDHAVRRDLRPSFGARPAHGRAREERARRRRGVEQRRRRLAVAGAPPAAGDDATGLVRGHEVEA